MATSSQTPDASEASVSLDATSGTNAREPAKLATTPVAVSKARLDSDLSFLDNAALADFTVVCGKKEWKTHKFVLSRCPCFKPIVSQNGAFKESQDSSITIEGFESFEIGWLLRYIYSLQFDLEEARATNPNDSYLETCVLIWNLGDYFSLPELCHEALCGLREQCKNLFIASRRVSFVCDEISLLSDLEAGIRAAWRIDRIAGPARAQLMTVATGLHPYLRNQPSFTSLFDDIPEFTTHFVKALLGCPGFQTPLNTRTRATCQKCNSLAYDENRGEGKQFVEGAFTMTPNSLSLREGTRVFFCSKDCYNSCANPTFQYPEKLFEA